MIIDSTYFWLILAVGLAVLEACTSTLVCIWFVAGSLLAFFTSIITDSIVIQMLVFSFASGVSLAVTRPLAKKILSKKTTPTNADMLIGKTCIVTEDIIPGSKGRVTVDGLGWMAESGIRLEKGEKAEIKEIRGATLVVYPIKENILQ